MILCSNCSNRLKPGWLDKVKAIASKLPEIVVHLVINAIGGSTSPGGLDRGEMTIHCKKCGHHEKILW